jgi:hypothetical protein
MKTTIRQLRNLIKEELNRLVEGPHAIMIPPVAQKPNAENVKKAFEKLSASGMVSIESIADRLGVEANQVTDDVLSAAGLTVGEGGVVYNLNKFNPKKTVFGIQAPKI